MYMVILSILSIYLRGYDFLGLLHSPLVFQCVLVQDEFRWCKSFLFFLTHIGKVSSFKGLSMGHATRFLLHRHRKARKESVNLWKSCPSRPSINLLIAPSMLAASGPAENPSSP